MSIAAFFMSSGLGNAAFQMPERDCIPLFENASGTLHGAVYRMRSRMLYTLRDFPICEFTVYGVPRDVTRWSNCGNPPLTPDATNYPETKLNRKSTKSIMYQLDIYHLQIYTVPCIFVFIMLLYIIRSKQWVFFHYSIIVYLVSKSLQNSFENV